MMAATPTFRMLLDELSEPAALFDPRRGRAHETRALIRLLDAEPEAHRVREAMGRAADSVTPGPSTFELGPPLTVGTRRSTYHVHPAHLPGGWVAPHPAVLVLVHDRGDRLPDPPVLMRRFDLTRRQADVALLLARRRTNPEIARDLVISPHTARRHTEVVLAKLGVRSRRHVLDRIRDDLC